MRTITLIIIHCSATPQGSSLSFEECRRDHIMHRHFRDIGYHYYITRDGVVHEGRPIEKVGHTAKVITPTLSASATKADLTPTASRPTPGLTPSVRLLNL